MRPVLPLLLCTTLAVTACSRVTESRFNPLNWFGRSEVVAPQETARTEQSLVPETGIVQIVDSRGLVGSVVSLSIDRTPDGAIIRATGTTTAPGGFNAQLVPTAVENGVLNLAFRVQSPGGNAGSRVEPRQITAAYLISNAELAGVRGIQVQGATNALVSRR